MFHDTDQRKHALLDLLSRYIENLPKQNELFEFSQDTKKEELKIRKAKSPYDGFVAMA